MKKYSKVVAVILCICLLIPQMSVFAEESSQPIPQVTMKDIYSTETETIYTSDETVFYTKPSNGSARIVGQYPIYTRMRTTQSSSAGLITCDSKAGTYASISSLALSFFKGVSAMRVSMILSVVGLVAGEQQYTQAKTYKSFVDYQKIGEARWSNESYFTPWVYSGQRNYYKHVLGSTQNAKGQWTTKSYDYLSTPAAQDTGNFYNKSTSWFQSEANMRCQTQQMLDDLPW